MLSLVNPATRFVTSVGPKILHSPSLLKGKLPNPIHVVTHARNEPTNLIPCTARKIVQMPSSLPTQSLRTQIGVHIQKRALSSETNFNLEVEEWPSYQKETVVELLKKWRELTITNEIEYAPVHDPEFIFEREDWSIVRNPNTRMFIGNVGGKNIRAVALVENSSYKDCLLVHFISMHPRLNKNRVEYAALEIFEQLQYLCTKEKRQGILFVNPSDEVREMFSNLTHTNELFWKPS